MSESESVGPPRSPTGNEPPTGGSTTPGPEGPGVPATPPGAAAPPPPPSPPTGGEPPPDATPPHPIPWEERGRLGFLKALIETVKLFTTAPRDAFRRVREKGDYASPLVWVLVISFVTHVVQWLWVVSFIGTPLSFLPGNVQDLVGPIITQFVIGGSFAQVFIGPIVTVIGVFIGSAILHVCLMLVDALNDSRSGFEGTFRAVGYAYLGQLARIIPFVGGLIGLAWTLVLLVIGLTVLHRTPTGKAVMAALVPLLLCCLLFTLFVALAVGLIGGLAREV